MNKMNNYIGDELANKVKILSLSLNDAEKIIEQLEQENITLKNLLELASENNNTILDSEAIYA